MLIFLSLIREKIYYWPAKITQIRVSPHARDEKMSQILKYFRANIWQR